jgi:hypothetical protein
VATNYSTNPSVETDTTGWATAQDGTAITSGVVGSRSTAIAAVGSASFLATFTAPGAGSAGWFAGQQQVTLPHAVLAGERYSINLWALANIQTGSPVLASTIEIDALWYTGASLTRTDTLGTVATAGGNVSSPSVAPPVGATSVIVRAKLALTSWASGNVVRLYSDALAVTVP